MEIVKETLSNGNTIRYQIVNGTAYHAETSPKVIELLEWARTKHIRLELDYGNTLTGKSWGEVYDIKGTIGRSTGTIKVPLLIKTSRSISGGPILDHCIVAIRFANKSKGGYLYRHASYMPINV